MQETQTAKALFDRVSIRCSQLTTRSYSTSFSLGIRFLDKRIRNPIYAIYGFVRFADEIVDSFHDYDKELLLNRFEKETYDAIDQRISLNPILNSFQYTVNKYNIEKSLVEKFLHSMRMDLSFQNHNAATIDEYILGSAEVVGLMCLRVFCNGDDHQYQSLKSYAMKLGSAFQKINFLRDVNADYHALGRNYFPGVDLTNFNEREKRKIESDIAEEFAIAYEGIKKLPRGSRFGVYVAYIYYLSLFKKIKNTPSRLVLKQRIRINNRYKLTLLVYSFLKDRLNLI